MTRGEFYEAAVTFCFLLGGSMTSGYRTRTRNGAVNGVRFSAHQVGLGVDVVYDLPGLESERREWARRLGLTIVVENDHDHLQPAGWTPG